MGENAPGGSTEHPVFFPPGTGTYFGLVTAPSEEVVASDVGVVLLAGTQPGCTTVGRNRLWVTIARRLAEDGFPVIRFDYAGLGESLGGSVEYDLDRPAVDALSGAIDELAERGASRVVLVGTCYGSRTALAGGADDDRVVSLLLLAPPVRNVEKGRGASSHLSMYASKTELARKAVSVRTVRRLIRSRTARRMAGRVLRAKMGRGPATPGGDDRFEAAPAFMRPFRTLVERGIPVRVVFGDDDYFFTEFERAQSEGRLGDLIDTAGELVEIEVVPGTVRGFASLDVQRIVTGEVVDRVRAVAS